MNRLTGNLQTEPSKSARYLGFAIGFVVIVMFALPIAGIVQHAFAVEAAERDWKEKERKSIEETNKLIEAFNKAVEKSRNERKAK